MATGTGLAANVYTAGPINFASHDADGTIESSTAAHGLGDYPEFVQLWAQCTTAENGYSIGDRVLISINNAGSIAHKSNEDAFYVFADNTNITLKFTEDGNDGVANLRHATGGQLVQLTLANWSFYLKAARFA